ncbi:MAG: hypothetical protein WCO54_07865, partial [Bacteroidota bacterium]
MKLYRYIKHFIYRTLLMLCLLYVPFSSFAQFSNFWAFGYNNIMDFNTQSIHTYTNTCSSSGKTISSGEVGTFMCDKRGTLLFGLMEDAIVDKNLGMMINGSTIYRSCGYNSIIIIPFVGDTNQYYIFYFNTDSAVGNGCIRYNQPIGLYYSIVDMRLNGGLGGVKNANTRIFNGQGYVNAKTYTTTTNSRNANVVKHQNGKDYWLITNNDTCIISYLINANGI